MPQPRSCKAERSEEPSPAICNRSGKPGEPSEGQREAVDADRGSPTSRLGNGVSRCRRLIPLVLPRRGALRANVHGVQRLAACHE